MITLKVHPLSIKHIFRKALGRGVKLPAPSLFMAKNKRMFECRRLVLSRSTVYFAMTKLTLSFAYAFHIPCIILSSVHFNIVLFLFLFLFNQSQSKAGVVNQIIHPCFRNRRSVKFTICNNWNEKIICLE